MRISDWSSDVCSSDLKASIVHFRSLGLDLIPGSGLLAPCVPGAVDGWLLMLRDYGTIGLDEALAPAIHYALQGCPLVPRVIDTINRKGVGEGKGVAVRVDLGGRRMIKKKQTQENHQ